MSKVFIALQDNEESHYIVEAIEEDNSDCTVIYQPAMIRIEKEGQMVIKRETVEEKMGRDWEVQALHVRVNAGITFIPEDPRTKTATIAAVAWVRDNYPKGSYIVPAHVERQGPFDPTRNKGWNIEHFRDFNNAAPDIAIGFDNKQPLCTTI